MFDRSMGLSLSGNLGAEPFLLPLSGRQLLSEAFLEELEPLPDPVGVDDPPLKALYSLNTSSLCLGPILPRQKQLWHRW